MNVNPAGIAFVDTFQLVGGYTARFSQDAASTHRLLGQAVL